MVFISKTGKYTKNQQQQQRKYQISHTQMQSNLNAKAHALCILLFKSEICALFCMLSCFLFDRSLVLFIYIRSVSIWSTQQKHAHAKNATYLRVKCFLSMYILEALEECNRLFVCFVFLSRPIPLIALIIYDVRCCKTISVCFVCMNECSWMPARLFVCLLAGDGTCRERRLNPNFAV